MYSLLIYDPTDQIKTKPALTIKIEIAKDRRDLLNLLCKKEWDTIITFGEKEWSLLEKQPYHIRHKWIHLDTFPGDQDLLAQVQQVYYNYTKLGSSDVPLVSIYTPTYNSREFILQTASSVQMQIWQNWEWIIVDDGSTDDTVALLEMLQDPRIKIFKFPNSGRIGFNKGAATSLAKGDYLVELDHDDFLTVNALDKVVRSFTENPDAGMVYSNCAEWWQGTDQSNTYNATYWRYRDVEWNGITLKEGLCHDVMGKCELENGSDWVINNMPICPNHLRAFRASTLREIGGYRNLVWADDYDVMLRMFIHSRIHHIDEMLYVQRFGTNTWTKNASLLWPCFAKIKENYRDQLTARFAELENIIQLPL
jgi:glycosyltransferase involved in cell wall biosynthesis